MPDDPNLDEVVGKHAQEEKSIETSEETSEETKEGVWWQSLLWGLGLFVMAGGLYWYFTDFENSDDTSRRMHVILAILYGIGGKNLACGAVAALGALFCFFSFRELMESKKK